MEKERDGPQQRDGHTNRERQSQGHGRHRDKARIQSRTDKGEKQGEDETERWRDKKDNERQRLTEEGNTRGERERERETKKRQSDRRCWAKDRNRDREIQTQREIQQLRVLNGRIKDRGAETQR